MSDIVVRYSTDIRQYSTDIWQIYRNAFGRYSVDIGSFLHSFQIFDRDSADIRQTFGGYSTDIRRIYLVDIRSVSHSCQIFDRHSADIRQTFGGYSTDIQQIFS